MVAFASAWACRVRGGVVGWGWGCGSVILSSLYSLVASGALGCRFGGTPRWQWWASGSGSEQGRQTSFVLHVLASLSYTVRCNNNRVDAYGNRGVFDVALRKVSAQRHREGGKGVQDSWQDQPSTSARFCRGICIRCDCPQTAAPFTYTARPLFSLPWEYSNFLGITAALQRSHSLTRVSTSAKAPSRFQHRCKAFCGHCPQTY